MSQPDQEFTNHAMRVLWGQFVQQIGLIEALESVTLHQKRGDHTPQTKVIEFLVAILAGLPQWDVDLKGQRSLAKRPRQPPTGTATTG